MERLPFRYRLRLAGDSVASSQLAADALVQKFRFLPAKTVVPEKYADMFPELLPGCDPCARTYTLFCRAFAKPPETLHETNALLLLGSLIAAHVLCGENDDPVRRCLRMTYRQYSEAVGFPEYLPKKDMAYPMSLVVNGIARDVSAATDYLENIERMIGCAEHIAELSERDDLSASDEILEYVDLAMQESCDGNTSMLLPDIDYDNLRSKGRLMPTDPMRKRYGELMIGQPEKYLRQAFEAANEIRNIFVLPFL